MNELPQVPEPHKLGPMDREQFAFAMQLSSHASVLNTPVENPAAKAINIIDPETDELMRVAPRDIPFNRAMIAAVEHFEGDVVNATNFWLRLMALTRLMQNETMQAWKKSDPEDPRATLFHNAVIYAAAELPLQADGNFSEDEFFSRAAEIADES